jgi:hypothetical protein
MYSTATQKDRDETIHNNSHKRCEIVDMTTFLAVALALLLGFLGTIIGSFGWYNSIQQKPNVELSRTTHSEMITTTIAMTSNVFCTKSSRALDACTTVVNSVTSSIYSANFDDDFKYNLIDKQVSALGYEIKFQPTTILSGQQINKIEQTCTNSNSFPNSKFSETANFMVCVLPEKSYNDNIFGSSELIEATMFLSVTDKASDSIKGAFQNVMIKFIASETDIDSDQSPQYLSFLR